MAPYRGMHQTAPEKETVRNTKEEGVPKGSVFGVLHFTIVTNTVACFLPATQFVLYSDELGIYTVVKTLQPRCDARN